MLEGVGDSN